MQKTVYPVSEIILTTIDQNNFKSQLIHTFMKLLKYRILFLFLPFIYAGCSSESECPDVIHPVTQQHQAKDTACDYSIYIENSLSLNGYLKASGPGNFKRDIYDMISSLFGDRQFVHNLNLYDVNSKLIQVDTAVNADALVAYVDKVDEQSFAKRSKSHGGNQLESNIDSIFKIIFSRLRKRDVALLITDGIVSPGEKDAAAVLDAQHSKLLTLTKTLVQRLGVSSLVLQFHSDFKGIYYYQDDTRSKTLPFHKRPYYIFCFGSNAALEHLMETVQQQHESGLQHFMFLDATGNYDPAPVINVASDYYDYDPCRPLRISGLRKSEADGKCRIKVNLDLSRLHQEEAYIGDIHNYALTAGYAVERIQAAVSTGYTHQLTLVSAAPRSGDLQLSLRRKLPDWVNASNLNADKGLSPQQLECKTFGITSLLDGMFEAYSQSMKDPSNYFTIHISVND